MLNKNINFNKNVTESEMENLHKLLERRTLYFSSYKNRELKLKLLELEKVFKVVKSLQFIRKVVLTSLNSGAVV